MIPNMKFYVISIAAIFLALGIGIYIGFILDSQDLIVEQRQGIVSEIEERFNFLSDENKELRESLELEKTINNNYEYFIESTYEEIIKNKLSETNVAIIETNNDYMYSGVGQVLEKAGANVVNVTTLTDKFMDKDLLNKLYNELELIAQDENIIKDSTGKLFEAIATGKTTDFVIKLSEKGFIDSVGLMNMPVDYIIIAGGSIEDSSERIDLIDSTIIKMAKNMSIPIIGIEKLETNYSYIGEYKKLGISTVDNIDNNIGKVSLVLAMEGRPGHYGLKDTAEKLIPNLNVPLANNTEE